MNATEFLASIKAKFATPEHYAAAVKAVGKIMRERDELRAAIFGGSNYLPELKNGNFREMAETLHRALDCARQNQKLIEAERDAARALLREAGEVVQWYGENARLCRLIHSGGDTGRQSLSNDGGSRARAFLDKLENTDG